MNKNIIIVSHKFLTQPDDDLVEFLSNKKYDNILHIRHSFSDAKDRRSFYTWYKKGKLYKEGKSLDYKFLPEFLLYFKEWLYTTRIIVFSFMQWDKYIGMDGLCVMFGNILRSFSFVSKTVYWAIDFVPENRFSSSFKNKIYHFINTQGYKNSDEMWDLSPRMSEARMRYLKYPINGYKMQKVVPYGVWKNRIKHYDYKECDKDTVVFMGHLLKKQGVQLMLRALPVLLKKNTNLKFKIIGEGNYKNELQNLARELKIFSHCIFLGKIEDHRRLEMEIAKSCIAIAPYIKELDTWTYYADPGKVKTYLACGVPVLLTDIPWNAGDIIDSNCGMILNGEIEDLTDKVLKLISPKINQKYRENALEFADKFTYFEIFSKLSL